MAWVRIDDAMPSHPKFAKLGDAEFAMFVRALCYSNHVGSKGLIPDEVLPRLSASKHYRTIAERLSNVRAMGSEHGLFERVDGGYRIHDYHQYQPKRDTDADLREKRQAAGRKGGLRSGEVRATKQVASSNPDEATKQDEAPIEAPGPARPGPAQVYPPVPTEQDPPQGGSPPSDGSIEGSGSKAGEVSHVFAAYLEGRKGAGLKGPEPKLTQARKDLVARRRRDGYSVAELEAATRGIWLDGFHREENFKHATLELALRDAAHIERFAAVYATATATKATPQLTASAEALLAKVVACEPAARALGPNAAALAERADEVIRERGLAASDFADALQTAVRDLESNLLTTTFGKRVIGILRGLGAPTAFANRGPQPVQTVDPVTLGRREDGVILFTPPDDPSVAQRFREQDRARRAQPGMRPPPTEEQHRAFLERARAAARSGATEGAPSAPEAVDRGEAPVPGPGPAKVPPRVTAAASSVWPELDEAS